MYAALWPILYNTIYAFDEIEGFGWKPFHLGDEVVLLGSQDGATLTAQDWASESILHSSFCAEPSGVPSSK